MCNQFIYDKFYGYFLTGVVSVLINVVNYLLSMFVETFAESIGYNTLTEKYRTIMVCTFVSSFVNTGLITLIVNADFTFSPYAIAWLPVHMAYTDLTRTWWLKIGTSMVQTVMIQAFMPIISAMISIGITTPKRWLDSGFPCCPSKLEIDDARIERKRKLEGDEGVQRLLDEAETRKATSKVKIFDYVNLYAGPEFKMHSNYAKVILLIFVCFMYAVLIPVLFPICMLALINTYLVDKLMLTYWYKRPPMYDDKIYVEALHLLRLAPLLTFALGYWALSNSQMFRNKPILRAFANQGGNPRHSLIDWNLAHLNQGHMALIIFGFWFLRIFLYDCIKDKCSEHAEPERKTKKRLSKKDQKKAREALIAKMGKSDKGGFSAFAGFGAAKTESEEEKPEEKPANDSDDDNFEMDEGLPCYWLALNGRDQKHWFAQEVYSTNQLGQR